MSQSAVEGLFAERWDDVIGLVEAFRQFEEKTVDLFEAKAGPTVREWLSERGFELKIEPRYGEYCAYRTNWLNADGDPVVKLTVGGLYPRGLARSDAEVPYLWVYLKLDPPDRSSVAEQLGQLAGPSWLNPNVKDKEPLGKYLRQDSPNRVQLVGDAKAMADFAIGKFPEVLALEDLLKRALPAIA